MRQHRFTLSGASSTVLAIMLIAIPYFALATNSDNIYIYPSKVQSQTQQVWHQYECHSCALGQTRFGTRESIAQAAVSTPIPTTPYHRPQRHVARGAARGAAAGAVGGAITGDPAKGAAAGAAMGGTAGAFRRRDQRRQQSIQQQPMQPQ
jgi:hypothetical protein